MCVHMVCVTGMPNDVLVWVDGRGPQTLVLVDESLFRGGELTSDGMIEVNRALTEQQARALFLRERPPLRAVAG